MVSTGSSRGPLEDLQVASLVGSAGSTLSAGRGTSSSRCGASMSNSADVLCTCSCQGTSSSPCGAPMGDSADVLRTCAAAQAGARPLGTASKVAEREPAALMAAEKAATPRGVQPETAVPCKTLLEAAGRAAHMLACYLGFVLLLLGISLGAWTYGSHDGSTEATAIAAVPLLLAAVPLLLVTIAVGVLFDFLVEFLVPVLVDLWAGLERIRSPLCCVARAAYAVLNRKVVAVAVLIILMRSPVVTPRGGVDNVVGLPA